MSDDKTICAVCAWRQDCKKKFAIQSSGQLRCPDFTRDLAFPVEKEEEDQ